MSYPHRLHRALERALLAAALAVGTPATVAVASDASDANDRGIARAEAGDLPGAIGEWERAAALARASGDDALAMRALANRGRAEAERGDAAAARATLAEAQALALARDDAGAGETLAAVGDAQWILVRRGAGKAALPDTQRAFAAASEHAERTGDRRLAARARLGLARVYAEAGRRDEAIALARQAAFAAQEAQAEEWLAVALRELGRWLAAAGDDASALETLRRAARAAEAVRAAPGGESVLAAEDPVHLALADLLLRRAAVTADAGGRAALLAEARDAAEAAKAAELRDYFHDECVDAARARARGLDAVSRDAAVLYPILLPDRTELLVSFPDGEGTRLERFGVAATAAEIDAEARTLRALLEKRTTRQYLAPARRLYDRLIRPIEAPLAASGARTLVWVPDRALRAIPLAALHDGEQFLIERIAVATTPGLSLTDPKPLPRARLRMLVSAVTQPREGFAGLAHARAEVDALGSLLGGEALVDERFEVRRFQQALAEEPFDVVHVASHGEFRGSADESYLLAWDGRISMDALGAAIGARPFREDPLELLTLSACETAQGDDRAALGLAGAAVRTGARSVLGTLWQVQDDAAAKLVVPFYTALREPGVSRAEALRRAQRALLAAGHDAHPAAWSAFVLIGSWL